MSNKSNTLRVLELMSLADLRHIADYRDLSTGGTKEQLARRISDDVNLSELVSADGPWTRDAWNDFIEEHFNGQRRRSFDEVLTEIESGLAEGGGGPQITANHFSGVVKGNTVYALVIGNQNYRQDPLANAKKDADDFAQMMVDLGHDTHVYFDLTLDSMREIVQRTAARLSPQRGLLFYYSGHGAECNDENWLIPIDCKSDDDDSLERQSLSLRKALRAFNKARFRITILDACRSNPFRGVQRGGHERGLREFHPPYDTPEGDLICYATAPRTTASDGKPGKNGVFTGALLKHFPTGGESIGNIMIRVRREVKELTSSRQIPWDHSSLTAHWFPKPVVGISDLDDPGEDTDYGEGSDDREGDGDMPLPDGASIAQALRAKLPQLRQDRAANGSIVFVDGDGLQRVMVYEYRKHCNVRLRCSQSWGFRGCGHTKHDKNANDWLTAMRVRTDKDIEGVVDRYMIEWRKAAL